MTDIYIYQCSIFYFHVCWSTNQSYCMSSFCQTFGGRGDGRGGGRCMRYGSSRYGKDTSRRCHIYLYYYQSYRRTNAAVSMMNLNLIAEDHLRKVHHSISRLPRITRLPGSDSVNMVYVTRRGTSM